MSSVMLNIAAEWRRASKRVKTLEEMFATIRCGFKEAKNYKSDEGVLSIMSCNHKKHPHIKGRSIPECRIELCPWREA